MNLDFIHEQQVDDAECFIGMMDDGGSPARRVRKKFAVRHIEGAAVRHVNGKRAVGPSLMYSAKLFNGHVGAFISGIRVGAH